MFLISMNLLVVLDVLRILRGICVCCHSARAPSRDVWYLSIFELWLLLLVLHSKQMEAYLRLIFVELCFDYISVTYRYILQSLRLFCLVLLDPLRFFVIFLAFLYLG